MHSKLPTSNTDATHLSDEALLEMGLARHIGPPPPRVHDASVAHLHSCAACAARYDDVTRWLDGTSADGRAIGDGLLTEAFLAQQRRAVIDTIESLDRPARVLNFPVVSASLSPARRTVHRWISAAAVAGLVLGVSAGRLLEFPPSHPAPGGSRIGSPGFREMSARQDSPSARQPATSGDEAFLVEIDSALAGTGIRQLRAIDALTPHVRETALNLR